MESSGQIRCRTAGSKLNLNRLVPALVSIAMKMFSLSVTAGALVFAGMLLPAMSLSNDESESRAWRGQTLTEFAPGKTNGIEWQVVNDGVMGGLSKGKVSISAEGTMEFTGILSLENNGGFSLTRSNAVDFNLSDDLGVLVRVKGDGRTYDVRLESEATYRGMPVSFSGAIPTLKGEWTEVKVPFSEFKGSWRGTDLPKKELNPAVIRSIGILLGDKKSGPFELEIDYIRTYGKGKGEVKAGTMAVAADRTEQSSGSRSLIETAVADGRFTTLKAALDAAGLTPFFQWDNKLTVFAPTDDAFAKLPEGVLQNLLRPENKEQLVAILSLHVHAGSKDLASALSSNEVSTIEGSPLTVTFSKGRVTVNKAALIDADIDCSDGIIHVIDRVLLPETK